ncbi:tetratricopeptide repeat protein [Nonomuraea angiospora]|uniref:tetratricopeptide repeat protein n=1 Tax=Nonomuraea angiospora TaxID=46172 RepID=UPI003441DDE3
MPPAVASTALGETDSTTPAADVLAAAFAQRARLVDADTVNRELSVLKAAVTWWRGRGWLAATRSSASSAVPHRRTAPGHNLGVIHTIVGRLDDALAYLESALTLNDNAERPGATAALRINRVHVYYRQGRFDEAIAEARQLVELWPKTDPLAGAGTAHDSLGDVYRHADRLTEAMESYTMAVRLLPESGYRLGEAMSRLWAFAAEDLRLVITLPRTPRTNAICERVIGTLRRELLDRILIVSERHLVLVLREYLNHYNEHRTSQRSPPTHHVTELNDLRSVRRKPLVAGTINENHHATAGPHWRGRTADQRSNESQPVFSQVTRSR